MWFLIQKTNGVWHIDSTNSFLTVSYSFIKKVRKNDLKRDKNLEKKSATLKKVEKEIAGLFLACNI
jgi:hypothetical protein